MGPGRDLRPAAAPGAALEWGVAARPLPGETACGDQHVVAFFPTGGLVGVVDGLGHGPAAAAAAEVAIATLARAAQESVAALVQRCHEALARTRGVVLTLASVNAQDGTLTWLGVGNVEATLLRADPTAAPPRESVGLRGGVVGYDLPALHPRIVPIAPGDVLVVATDGIRGDFAAELRLTDPPQRLADQILARCGKRTDDALVLVVRYRGTRNV